MTPERKEALLARASDSAPSARAALAEVIGEIETLAQVMIGNGLALRDYFAGLAMQGMLANARDYADLMSSGYAEQAYLQADAMLAAREAKP